MTFDKIEKNENMTIQHGKNSDRIYLMKSDFKNINKIFLRFSELIEEFNYTKIFAKIPHKFENSFLENGFVREAGIPFFYSDSECVFMAKYPDSKRKIVSTENKRLIADVLQTSLSKHVSEVQYDLPDNHAIIKLNESNAEELVLLYRNVFETYPFPVFERSYIIETMNENVVYFGYFIDGKLTAASSAEIDYNSGSAEMTDFAVYSDLRGNGTALKLLNKMESEMRQADVSTVYTIARAVSHGMNVTFAKSGYKFGGTLINNTGISGHIESMNVWYKHF